MTAEIQPKRRRWLRRLVIVLGCLVGLGVLLYFVVTSGTFFQQVILPKVSQSLGAEVTVSDATIHPFSEVILRDLKVRTSGETPLLTARELKARYSLRQILGGNLHIDEAVLDLPRVHVVQRADGSSNLDPILKGAASEKEKDESKEDGQPPNVQIRQVRLQQGFISVLQETPEGGRQTMILSNANLALNNVRNGASGTFNLSASLLGESSTPTTNGQLMATLDGKFAFDLNNALQPVSIQGRTDFAVERASGSWTDLDQLRSAIDCQLTPSEIKQLALTFQQRGTPLGIVQVAGPLDLAKEQGDLQLVIHGIDQRLLNLLASGSGWDFGATTLTSTNQLRMRQKSFELAGQTRLAQLSLSRDRSSTPTLDLVAQYGMTVDQAAEIVRVSQFQLAGTQNGKPFLRGLLGGPLELSWSQKTPDAAVVGSFALELTQLRLSDWAGLLGTNPPSGTIQANLQVSSRPGGVLGLHLLCRAEELAVTLGTNRLSRGTANADLSLLLGKETQQVQGTIAVSNIIGRLGDYVVTNLASTARLDLALANEVAELRQVTLTLPPTERAANALQLTGRVDLAAAEAIRGHLALSADALDLTPFYSILQPPAEPKKTDAKTEKSPPPAEPAPTRLPTQDFRTELRIGRLFLHELSLSNWVTDVLLNTNRVQIHPARVVVNGAPVDLRADINVGIPGYGYDVALNALNVPIEPLANSFLDVRPGAYKGDLLARLALKGVGTTGPSLRQHLRGNVSLLFTNAEIQLVAPFLQRFLNPIGALIGVPDLVQAPLNHIVLQATATNGQIHVQQCGLQSSLFTANTAGVAPIADDLMQSPLGGWPMQFALRRGLAERIKMVPSQTPPDVQYIQLPEGFIQVTGVLGKPESKVDAKALALAGVQTAVQQIPQLKALDQKTGGLIGGLLGGKKDTNAPPKDPNAPKDTNTPPAKPFNPLDLLKKKN